MKTFDQYIDEYLADYDEIIYSLDNIRNWILSDNFLKQLRSYFHTGEYRYIPFEIKLGLFKFICDDLNMDYFNIAWLLKTEGIRDMEIKSICPEEFLKQIV